MQTMQTADRRPCRLSTFFLILVLLTFDSHIFFGFGHKLVFNYISECLLCTGLASSVCDCWRDVDFARETPFGPKRLVLNAYVKLFQNLEINFTCNLMPHVTCAFSTLGVQNVIPNGCWSVTAITSKKPSTWKPNSIWNSQCSTVAMMSWCDG